MTNKLALWLAAAMLLLAALSASAQDGKEFTAEQHKIIADLAKKADALAERIDANRDNDADLVQARLDLEDVDHQLLQGAVAFRPRLSEINARLEQLGAAPKDGEPAEPEIVLAERQALLAEKAEINALIGKAEDLSIRIKGQVDHVAQLRRDLFANTLTKRYHIDLDLVGEVIHAARTEAQKFVASVSSWVRFVVSFKLSSVLGATFFAVLAAAVLLIGGRRLLGTIFDPDPENADPTYLGRLSVAFWSTLLPSAAVAVFLGATYLLYDYFQVLRGDIGEMLVSLFIVIAVVYFVHRLGRSALSPGRPDWRLIAVDSKAARRLVVLISATAVFTGLDHFLASVFDVMGSPLALTVGESLVSTVITGVLVVLIGRVKPYTGEDGTPRPWPKWLRIVLYVLGGLTIAAALFGYIGFSRFMSRQIVITGALLGTMYIGFLSGRAIYEEGAFANTAPGRALIGRFKLDISTLDQLGLVISILIYALVILAGVPLILLQWGFQPGDIRTWAYGLASGFNVGSVTISFIGILTGILVFIIGYFGTRWFQGWLDGTVMARGRVDAGVRNSIRTAVGYAGVALAGLIGISAAGIDLSNLALVAGALSLGIGFGLQNVVSNFVSGLILLAERPFKVGDWIVAGAVSGTVKKISVRATEIETFQRQTVILPNSELINAAVGNWTHRNRLGRIDLKVSVAPGMDAGKAHALMVEVARSHPLVLKNPEPFVLFMSFGPPALEFEIRVFVADIHNSNVVQNDIRFGVLAAFHREQIDIPGAPMLPQPTPALPPDEPFEEAPPAQQRNWSRKARRRERVKA